MEITNNIWLNLNKVISSSIDDKINFRRLFNNVCILYGPSLVKLHNDCINLDKLNILCREDQYSHLKDFFVYKNNFIEIQTFDTHVFIKKINRVKNISFSVRIINNPIKSISNFVSLKIEEIYYNGKLVIHNNMKEFITMEENYNGTFSDSIIKRMKKYILFGYKFNIDDNGCKIILNSGNRGSYLKRLKYMFSFNIRNKDVQ